MEGGSEGGGGGRKGGGGGGGGSGGGEGRRGGNDCRHCHASRQDWDNERSSQASSVVAFGDYEEAGGEEEEQGKQTEGQGQDPRTQWRGEEGRGRRDGGRGSATSVGAGQGKGGGQEGPAFLYVLVVAPGLVGVENLQHAPACRPSSSSSSSIPSSCGPSSEFPTSMPAPKQKARLLSSMLLLLLLVAALLLSLINACLVLRRVLVVFTSPLDYGL